MTAIENIVYKKDQWVRLALIGLASTIVITTLRSTVALFIKYKQVSSNVQALKNTGPEVLHKYPDEFFNGADVNQVIFAAIGESAKTQGVTVKRINTPFVIRENDYLILTQEITIEGSFLKIMRCIDEMDEKVGFIKIVSLKFEREDSPRSSAMLLKVYFQMITSNDEQVD